MERLRAYVESPPGKQLRVLAVTDLAAGLSSQDHCAGLCRLCFALFLSSYLEATAYFREQIVKGYHPLWVGSDNGQREPRLWPLQGPLCQAPCF